MPKTLKVGRFLPAPEPLFAMGVGGCARGGGLPAKSCLGEEACGAVVEST